MTERLAVPVDAAQGSEVWAARIQNVALQGSQRCQMKDTVHSAICTITGTPDELVVNLACTATSESHVNDLMQYVNDTLLPQMEQSLGIQFEVRNLQFAVAGGERPPVAAENDVAPELLDGLPDLTNWLDRPFATPAVHGVEGAPVNTNETRSDLSMV